MPYLVRELITKAYYLSGIVGRELQTVSGQQITDGLDLLNDILEEQNIDQRRIPFYREYDLNTVAGQEKYTIPELITVETVTFNIGVVRYSMLRRTRSEYFGSSRADNIRSLPFTYHFERIRDGCELYLYFLPNQVYPVKIWGKFGLTEVGLDDDLALVYERGYRKYLTYSLAQEICEDYGIPLPPHTAQALSNIKEEVIDISPIDLSIRVHSSLRPPYFINYAEANLSTGWEPTS